MSNNNNNDIDEETLLHGLPEAGEQALIHEAFLRLDNPEPDVDAEWKAFSSLIDGEEHSSSHRIWPIWLGVAVAVCAALLLIVLPGEEKDRQSGIEVLAAIDNDANVTLSCDNSTPQIVCDRQISFNNAKSVGKNVSSGAMVVMKTPRGHECELTLPDGTVVWLNGESTLEFPRQFTGRERRVRMSGEAYFDVTKDIRRPFVVENSYFTTRVLGTSFSMRAYSATDASVTLVEGCVSMRGADAQEHKLRPGQMAQYGAAGFEIAETDTYPVVQRRAGFFYFDNEPLLNVMIELGRWYNKAVVFENEKAMQTRLHFVAERVQPIEEVIEALNEMDGVHADLTDSEITIK